MRRNTVGQVARAVLDVHSVDTAVSSSRRFMNTFEPLVRNRPPLDRPRIAMPCEEGSINRSCHLVEQQNRIAAAGEQLLRKP